MVGAGKRRGGLDWIRTLEAGFLDPALEGGLDLDFPPLAPAFEAGLALAFEAGLPLPSATVDAGLFEAFEAGLAALDAGLI